MQMTRLKPTEETEQKTARRRERLELEQQIARTRETEDLLQQLIDSMSDSLLLVDVSGVIIKANKAARLLLRFDEQEMPHPRISALLPGSAIPETPVQLLAQDGHDRSHLEADMRTRSGHLVQMSASCGIVRNNGGQVTGMLVVMRDIAERKQAEEVRSKLAAIVESSDDAIVGKDLNGIIGSWNAGAERLFGYRAEEIIGQSILTLIPPNLQGQEAIILRKLRAGERIEHFETDRITKSGKVVNVSLTISPIRDSSGHVIGASKIARDVSERKRAEEALRRTEKLAAAGRLAATIAHEINNPLEAVTNLIYLAKRNPSNANKLLDMASQELEGVSHIAKQTLGFYRETSSPVRFNVSDALENVLSMYTHRLDSRGIEVERQYDRQVEMMGLAGEIRQVFSNLIVNAIDSMANGGRLCVRVSRTNCWRRPGSVVRMTIADTGSGISRENRRMIFEAFYTTKVDIGTGLGLWVTRGIVEKHRGSIRFRSKATTGRSGTVFSVFLPAVPMQQRMVS